MQLRFGAMGWTGKLNDLGGEKTAVSWEVAKFGAVVAKGWAESKKKATDEAWAAFRGLIEAGTPGYEARKAARRTLRGLLDKRPYAVAGCAELVSMMLADGEVDLKRLRSEAKDTEATWYEKDDPKTRKPLPTHHLAMSAPDAFSQIHKLFDTLGLTKSTKVMEKWARITFGEQFFPKDEASDG